MTELLGQGEEFARVLAAARALRLPHGLIVEGLPGCGKTTAARLLAQALLCEASAASELPGTRLDGSCACTRRVASGAHADLHLVELPEDRQDIPVERVRELQTELERRPVEGRARVAIVDPADRLNEQGQNALLKTLEEPGADTFLLLVTSRPEALLDTVRSRTGRLRILPLDEATLRARLAVDPGGPDLEIETALRGCGGSLGIARCLLESDTRQLVAAIEAFLADPQPSAVAGARSLLDGATGRTETERRLTTLLRVVRAALRSRLTDTVAANSLASDTDAGYRSPSAEPWGSAIDAVFQAERDFASGIPANQVLDGLLLTLVGLLGGGPPVARASSE